MNIISFNILANKYAKIGADGFTTEYKIIPDAKNETFVVENNRSSTVRNETGSVSHSNYSIDVFSSENRLNNLKKIFDKYKGNYTVFCLQEVDLYFSQQLQKYFDVNNYSFYCEYFNSRFTEEGMKPTTSGNFVLDMGIATAVPREYKILEVFRYNPMWYSRSGVEVAPGVLKKEYTAMFPDEGRAKLYVDNHKDPWLVPPFMYPCWPEVPEISWSNWIWGKLGYMTSLFYKTNPIPSFYEKFLNIKNTLLVLKIDTGIRELLICNIQMPNMNDGIPTGNWNSIRSLFTPNLRHERSIPRTPDENCFMEAYMSLILKFIQHISKSEAKDPEYCNLQYILAGSFNFEPNSLAYGLLRYGRFSLNTAIWINNYFPKEAHKYFPRKNIEDKIQSSKEDFDPMRSIFNVLNGKEPNTVRRYHCGVEFKGTLDYIFLCNGIAPIFTKTIENKDDEDKRDISNGDNSDKTSKYKKPYLPNALNPSDHLPIYVQLAFKK